MVRKQRHASAIEGKPLSTEGAMNLIKSLLASTAFLLAVPQFAHAEILVGFVTGLSEWSEEEVRQIEASKLLIKFMAPSVKRGLPSMAEACRCLRTTAAWTGPI